MVFIPVIRRQRKFQFKVADIMNTPPITIHYSASVFDVAKLMFDKWVGSVMVVDDNGRLVGIITERDLVKTMAIGKLSKDLTAKSIMTEKPITILPDALVYDALKKMRNYNVRHLPVVNGENRPLGMISARDLLDAVLMFTEIFM
ncbi:MAG: CBS domain-containing protein [Sulfolobales archaeon]|nr:CBS domain-containing protein [Sulfolobales archaeon]MCX8186028.1 CBS domain-containing protein [Sulfolobales archaeon]MDW7969323.1 CBS domain-containing protein [Sulfolobales archaeon]